VEYTENLDCQSHYTLSTVRELPQASRELTLSELLKIARADLGEHAAIEFSRDIIRRLVCPRCGDEELPFAPVGSIPYTLGRCPQDGAMRIVETVHSYTGQEDFGGRRLDELGLPLYDVFVARCGAREIGYLPAGDVPLVLSAVM